MKKYFPWLFIIILVGMNLLLLREKQDSLNKINQISSEIENNRMISDNTSADKKNQTRLQINDSVECSRNNAITNAVKNVKASVVSINVIKTKIVKRYYSPFDSPFFNFYTPIRKNVKSIGTGVIYKSDGYIITNEHVVEGATQIKVVLPDNRTFEAEIIGSDNRHDIAIIKIEGENLPAAKLGNSDDVIIGEWSIALGNPYGYLIEDSQPTVSVGVISARNRDFSHNEDGKIYKDMIQTDTAINPGNSGGPLVNVLGDVIAVNTFIFSESGGNIGLGFAIPINRVKRIAQEIEKYGEVRAVNFGFYSQDINASLARYLGLQNTNGIIVTYIEDGGVAEKSGLKKGDIILRINRQEINNIDEAEMIVSDIRIGEKISLSVLREKKIVELEIRAQPK